MRIPQRRDPGFTLIELLIVVAIIAILALIAVPNFLEAQTRAKVSRARADMRTLAAAQEAYFVDWNSYTHCDGAENNGRAGGWFELTTPIAYVTYIQRDPFGIPPSTGGGHHTHVHPSLFSLGTGAIGVGGSGYPCETKEGFPSHTWECNSIGPNHAKGVEVHGGDHGTEHKYSWHDADYPWVNTPPNAPDAVAELLALFYDPTNGTVSRGEIYRAGGLKPPGRVFGYLYGAGSGR